MSDELRRLDDARYQNMYEMIEKLKILTQSCFDSIDEVNQRQQGVTIPTIEELKVELKENYDFLFHKDGGVFTTLHDHTVKISEISEKMESIKNNINSVGDKMDLFPKTLKVENLPRIIGMVAGGFVAGTVAVSWFLVKLFEHLK